MVPDTIKCRSAISPFFAAHPVVDADSYPIDVHCPHRAAKKGSDCYLGIQAHSHKNLRRRRFFKINLVPTQGSTDDQRRPD